MIVITGCANKPNPVFLNEISLSEAYPGNISEIDKIELLDGSSGERKVIEDQVVIEQWISKIKDIELTPDDNQEGRVGYVFGISLYEGDEIKLGFIPNQINKFITRQTLNLQSSLEHYLKNNLEKSSKNKKIN